VRNIVIDAEFEHLRIDHDHPALVRAHPVEQRQDHAVEADRFARSGRARDQQVRHRRNVGNDRIAGNILPQDQRQRHVLVLKRLAADQLAQRHRLALGVGELDADDAAARNGRDAGRQGGHVAGDVVGQLDDAAGLDPAGRFQLIHGDDRSGPDLDDVAADVEILEYAFQQRAFRSRPARSILPFGLSGAGASRSSAGSW
jgi:hypothetical protein